MQDIIKNKVVGAKEEILNSSVQLTENAKQDLEVAAEVAEFILSKKISAMDARYILKRTGEIIERIKIG